MADDRDSGTVRMPDFSLLFDLRLTKILRLRSRRVRVFLPLRDILNKVYRSEHVSDCDLCALTF